MAEPTSPLPGLRSSLADSATGTTTDETVETDPQPDKTTKPRRRSQPRERKIDNTKRPGGQTARKDLTEDLLAMFGSIAMPLFVFGANHPKLAYDAYVIMAKSDELAKALNALAQRNPAVHRMLFAMMNTTDSVVLLTAAANIAVPIAANHGLLPPAMAVTFGAPDPTTFDLTSMTASPNGAPTQ